MREIEDRVRDDLRRRLLARGGAPEYQDPEVFRSVDRLLRRAADRPERARAAAGVSRPRIRLADRDARAVCQPSAASPARWCSSSSVASFCRSRAGCYEYTVDNFQRQERVNRMLVACIEELAIENARLHRELEQIEVARRVSGPEHSARELAGRRPHEAGVRRSALRGRSHRRLRASLPRHRGAPAHPTTTSPC